MFGKALSLSASRLIDLCRSKGLLIATAESCTGGLIAGLITSVSGSSDVFDAGFVTYSNESKTRMVNVPADLIIEMGAVSEEVALAMALGAIANSRAHVAVSVTGIAGPYGGSATKPVGLVHCAAARRDGPVIHDVLMLGDIGRDAVRIATVVRAVELAYEIAALDP
jgi:nicotinamide-nucleotide amidase